MVKKFLLKLALFSTPFLLLLFGYLANDPFRVLYHYDDYSKNMVVIPNRDFVSTEVYLQNRAKQHYDSFIFGSSRTIGFRTRAWAKYLDKGAHPYVFDASAETIFGIHSKVKYIDEQGDSIKNALVLICRDATFAHDSDNGGHLMKKHPRVAGTSRMKFHLEFIRSYFDVNFIGSYYLYKMTRQYRPFMRGYIEQGDINYDPVTNDVTIIDQDVELHTMPVKYYERRADLFVRSNVKVEALPLKINAKQTEMLYEIEAVFKKHGTNYAVIISPLYSQNPFDQANLQLLQDVFGVDRVFDYSGVNRFTENMENYYEESHFRPIIGEQIMQEVYGKLHENQLGK